MSRSSIRPALSCVVPGDDRLEGQRALAQPADHHVAAGLDALGDGDLALARQQLDAAHLAQVHADRVVGAAEALLVDVAGRLLVLLGLVLGLLGLGDAGASPSSFSSLSTTWMPISLRLAITSSICSELFWSGAGRRSARRR